MRTLLGKPIEGELLKLYKYYYSLGGGAEEACQLAQSIGMLGDLMTLEKEQREIICNVIIQLMRHIAWDSINPATWSLPCINYQMEDYNEVIARYALQGVFEINVSFSMLVQKSSVPGAEYFCSLEHFQKFKNVTAFIVPLQDADITTHLRQLHPYKDGCFRIAQAIKKALWQCESIFRGELACLRAAKIKTNLPTLPIIDILTSFNKYSF